MIFRPIAALRVKALVFWRLSPLAMQFYIVDGSSLRACARDQAAATEGENSVAPVRFTRGCEYEGGTSRPYYFAARARSRRHSRLFHAST